MRTRYFTIVMVMAFGCVFAIHTDASAGWLVGSTFTARVDDSPLSTNFDQLVTLAPGTTTLDQGEMTLTQSIIPLNANSQWLTFDFEATGGLLLAGNSGSLWENAALNIKTSSPAYTTTLIVYWTVNGVATNPIVPFPGFTPVEPNPINPSLGPVYFHYAAPSGPGATSFSHGAFANPYGEIAQGGMDVNAVNGFTLGVLEQDAVPEPSSLASFAMGAVFLVLASQIRSRKASVPMGHCRCCP